MSTVHFSPRRYETKAEAIGSWHIALSPEFTAAISGFMPYKISYRGHAEPMSAKKYRPVEILSQLVGSILPKYTVYLSKLLGLNVRAL